MADGAHAATATRSVTLPFRIEQSPAARKRSSLYLIVGITAVCSFVAVLVYTASAYLLFDDAQGPSILAGLALLLMAWWSYRFVNKPSKVGLPLCSFAVSAGEISCNDLVEGAFPWGGLTAFRWVLQTPDKPEAAKGFVIEAAPLTDIAETINAGYYDHPAIQFDLDDLCLTQPSREEAGVVTAWLNALQAKGVAGLLRDGEAIEVPAFLNASPAATPAK